jgi:phosphonate transport system substrate-binding protein
MNNADTPSTKARGGKLFNAMLVLLPVLVLIAAAGGWYWMETKKLDEFKPDAAPTFRIAVDFPLTLDPAFVDADGDMVADAPSEPTEWIDPPTLVFAVLGSDLGREREVWADFVEFLKDKTKKPVELANPSFLRREQFAELANGKYHIVALSTGNVPAAVNLGGFSPFCVMADQEGRFGYQMEIIVPADSPVRSIQDLKGKRVAFANFQSHSGFKLPLVTLWEAGLHVERDYSWTYTGNQSASVNSIANKRCDAAGVASDALRREVATGKIQPEQYRTIFRSDTYPSACFGHARQLKPDLANAIREAFLRFPWAGSSLEKAYKESNQVQFVPIAYAKDWSNVRDTDSSLRKALGVK